MYVHQVSIGYAGLPEINGTSGHFWSMPVRHFRRAITKVKFYSCNT